MESAITWSFALYFVWITELRNLLSNGVFFASQKFFLGDHSSLIVQYGTVLLNTSFMMPVSGININIQLRVSEEDKAGDEQKTGYVCYKMLIHTTKYVLN